MCLQNEGCRREGKENDGREERCCQENQRGRRVEEQTQGQVEDLAINFFFFQFIILTLSICLSLSL